MPLYYIILKCENGYQDYGRVIADILSINLEEYHSILSQCNGFTPLDYTDIYFQNKSDAERALKELEPYLILWESTR